NGKQDFAAVSPAQMLEKVSRLPISEWSYKVDAATRHVGPVAQDFYSIFNIGTDDKHIAPMDEGGVALAAIKGPNQKLETDNAKLKQENDSLAKRLDELEAEVKTLAEKN
ncbi:MAG TPA: tail fiber domain-containing protein, partial [Candidatus Acidoferrales bacterium]|nr:tail fiber domain-containing protein [Candidatus Acidoferrales bacterium]